MLIWHCDKHVSMVNRAIVRPTAETGTGHRRVWATSGQYGGGEDIVVCNDTGQQCRAIKKRSVPGLGVLSHALYVEARPEHVTVTYCARLERR